MGRDKGQRVKGNLKPASSGRSAELAIPAAGGAVTFGSLSTGLGSVTAFVPLIPEPEETGLDAQLTLTLRKLDKKDATTKIKALTELMDICKKEESTTPLAILPYWPKIYSRLALDECTKVRELSHGLLDTIAASVGRNLAPQTKGLLPAWFLSQSDTFAPAASTARNGFNSIFPTEEKQKSAINFCLVELSTALGERLAGGTELSKITFLDGLNRLLRMEINLLDTLDFVLKQPGFWALGADESSVVRRTFYDVLSTVAEREGSRIPKSKLAAAIRKGFESERVEVQSLWNCFLTLAINIPFQDKEKELAETQILTCTKNAFYGHASQLGPLLLPLVAKLGVPNQIFQSLEEGLLTEKSMSERLAIVRTYAEVLSFVYKETETVPEGVFHFVTSQLSSMGELGRTLSALIKKDSFYDSLAQFCLERPEVLKSQSFGPFLLSFLKDKKSVQFSDKEERKDLYEGVQQKSFLRQLSLGLLHVKNFSSFGLIARYLSGSSFLRELLKPCDLSELFQFQHEDKLGELRLSLELVKAFPESPSSLAILSFIFDSFKDSQEDLELFTREIEPFDRIKEFRRWLKSGVFKQEILLSSTSKPLSKYILRRREIFGDEVVRAKLEALVSNPREHLDLARYFVHDGSGEGSVDLSPFYMAICDVLLDGTGNYELEEIAWKIVDKGLISREVLYQKSKEKAGEVESLVHLDSIATKAQRLMSFEELGVEPAVSVSLDPAILTFRGFGFLCLKSRDLSPPPQFHTSKALRQILFSAKQTRLVADGGNSEGIISTAKNLLYAATLVEISKDTWRRTWDRLPATEAGIYDEVEVLLKKYLEILAGNGGDWANFWKDVRENQSDSIWESKFPLEKLIAVTRQIELPLPEEKRRAGAEEAQFMLENIKDFLQNSQFDKDQQVAMGKVIETIQKKRNESPAEFHFEEQFNLLAQAEKDKLISILELVTFLVGQNVEFASVASCWVAAWLKQVTDIHQDKTSLLWTSKLSRAVVQLDKFAKTPTPFGVEYTEFHAGLLFPPVYSHFLQLAGSDEFWALEAAENVSEAVALIPASILNTLLDEPSKAFELFLPVALRNQVFFKVAAHSLLSKVSLTKEILPREFEAFSKRFRKVDSHAEEAEVTFLLLWDALLRAQPNGFELANYVKEKHLLPQALSLLFFNLLGPSKIGNVTSLKAYFDADPILTTRGISSITHLSAWVLQNLMRTLPYTVRWWWADLAKQRDKAHVERITKQFLSSKLAAEELTKVKWDEAGDTVTVNSHPGCSELIARYKIEETSVTLKITLPLNHPLGPVAVNVSDKKLHARISQLLNTRSHSLAAGLRLWKESLDTVYKDADECAICFFILHHQSKQLPKLGCKTCKKKFHAACLYKWFSTSNKSECPLCRNLW